MSVTRFERLRARLLTSDTAVRCMLASVWVSRVLPHYALELYRWVREHKDLFVAVATVVLTCIGVAFAIGGAL